jgi:hypothetical protein
MSPSGTKAVDRVSIRPGPGVLSVLRHLNYKPWFALAEFVDNAVQSFVTDRARLTALHGTTFKLKVSIDIDSTEPTRITVRDNATGIPLSDFPRAFRPAVVPPDRTGLSEFGMGMKSAACWFAPIWQVRTQALGENVERIVKFDVARIVRDELEELDIEERKGSLKGHFTEIVLDGVHHMPAGRTVGKIKEHLTDIYREFVRDGRLELTVNREPLVYDDPPVLVAPYAREAGGARRKWKKDIHFELGGGQTVTGFAAIRDPGNFARSGFALFRRGRLIQGSGDEGYRPPLIFGTSSGSYRHLRLFGELHLDGFEVSHTKDGFRWDENEQPFLELLKDHLDSDDLPLLRQCDDFRSRAPRSDRIKAATQALKRAGDAMEKELSSVLPRVADSSPVETRLEPLIEQPLLATRELRFTFRDKPWLVRIELSDDPAEGDWLSVSDRPAVADIPETIDIRLAMAHPFMVSFAQTDSSEIEALIRVGAALALSEKLARRMGAKMAGTVRRNLNEILREALSRV